MKTNRQYLFLALAASTSLACATANETPTVEDVQPTAEIGPQDTAPAIDTSNDTSVVDTSVVEDVGPDAEACTFPATQTKPCGYCGTHTRTCLAQGAWGPFGACTGERGDAECKIGEKKSNDCGHCGKATDYCDVTTCTWISGFCSGEGPCELGEEESTKASCSVVGEVRTRKCDSKCQWSDFSACGLQRGWLAMETAPITGRSRHAAVWNGSKMLVWGGYGTTPTYKGDGAAYDPIANKWSAMAAAPTGFSSGRRDPMAVWTGTTMIVFGGRDSDVRNDAAIYDPATDTWKAAVVPTTTLLSKRWGAAAVWSTTTNELLVWGGCRDSSGCSVVAGDGAAYDPVTEKWTALPAAPIQARGEVTAVWTGTDMLVFGGKKADGTTLVDGARFDPVTRAWTKFSDPAPTVYAGRFDHAAAWTGTSLAIWGGRTSTTATAIVGNGAIYTPMVGWAPISEPSDTVYPGGGRRFDHVLFHHGGKLYAFSGIGTATTTAASGMAAYDIATDSWTTVDTTYAPSARARASVVWTGREAIVFGGGSSDTATANYNNGGVYRP